jgi:hypothetical protein
MNTPQRDHVAAQVLAKNFNPATQPNPTHDQAAYCQPTQLVA